MLKTFNVVCSWYGVDETVKAVSGEAALKGALLRLGITETWGEDHEPADPDWGEGEGLCETWSVRFKGQQWTDGDYNIESLTVYAEEPTPC